MKVYYTHDKVSSFFKQIFQKVFTLSVPHLKNLSSIITSMIDAESVVSTDIARKFKDTFYPIQLASLERRFMRFFTSFSNVAYPFYESLISFVISNYRIKHSDKKVHISFDHMFCKDKFTILLFSLRIGKQGIPIWFRCFKGKHNPDAFKMDLIKDGIKFCKDLFPDDCHIIFLADRWFGNVELLSFIQNIGAFYCIRSKSFFTFSFFNKHGELITKHLSLFLVVLNTFKMYFTLVIILRLLSSFPNLLTLMTLGILLLMTLLIVLFVIILIVLVLLNLSLKIKNLMVLDLNLLILRKLKTLFLYLPFYALLFFGLLLLALITLKTSTTILLIFVFLANLKMVKFLEDFLFSILD